MHESSDFHPLSEEWLMSVQERFEDRDRFESLEDDSPAVRAARSYLKKRDRRVFIQEEAAVIDALPYRIAEILAARKLIKVAGVEVQNRKQRDNMLPTLARVIVDETMHVDPILEDRS